LSKVGHYNQVRLSKVRFGITILKTFDPIPAQQDRLAPRRRGREPGNPQRLLAPAGAGALQV